MNLASDTAVYEAELEGVHLDRECSADDCVQPAEYALLDIEADDFALDDHDELEPYVCDTCAARRRGEYLPDRRWIRLRYDDL